MVKRNKKRHVVYKFDQLLESHGHTVVRLPPYHPDLNTIGGIWATIKYHVAQKNVTFKLEDVRKLAEAEFEHLKIEEWQNRCKKVIKIEKDYLENETFIDNFNEVNDLIINLNDSDSDNSDSDNSDSSNDSDENSGRL